MIQNFSVPTLRELFRQGGILRHGLPELLERRFGGLLRLPQRLMTKNFGKCSKIYCLIHKKFLKPRPNGTPDI
jgi:hypothetical protein